MSSDTRTVNDASSARRILSARATLLSAAAVAVIGLPLCLAGCGEGPAVVPTSYNSYQSEDGTFKIDYPAGWRAEGGGKAGYAWAKFTSGSASINVSTSVTGSLLGDIAQSHNQSLMGQVDETRQPVAVVHAKEKAAFEQDSGVSEQEPVVITTAAGTARKSEHTGQRTFGAPIHGYRATTLTTNYRLRVVCQCSEPQWKALQPAFDKSIESLGQGRR